MKAKHILSHKDTEWFDIVDEDPDVDFETGAYIGISDKIKLSDGKWYPKNECVYISRDNEVKSCAY